MTSNVCTKPIRRSCVARASLASDRRRIATFSLLTPVEHIIVLQCYDLVFRALEVEFNPMFVFAAVPLPTLVSRLPISLRPPTDPVAPATTGASVGTS
ncbi:MAG TPA: hypothetical protein VGE08_07580 [Steroidobacter sp.]|uniref:hypothetical protein n=1 Tax=Steroidobacter sp. TaxID=1978227 RepID=UPI002ED90FF7